MPDTIISPNMTLPVPVVSTAPGPQWANDLNSCLGAIDSHNHTSGQGVPITPDALDINSSLSMENNSLVQTQSVVFQSQASLATLKAVYVIGVDLYYNDGSGNVIQITDSGSVAGASGTITGLPSGTASASYQSVGGTFRFQSATNTPANISGATVLISEQVASPNFISLKSPTSLASAYNVTFPAGTPAATSIVRMDTSGNLSNNLVTDNTTIEISSNALRIKDDGVTTAKILDANVTRPKLVAVGQQTSGTSNFTTASASYVDMTSAAITITTTGRPVFITVISGDDTGAGYITQNSAWNIRLVRDSTALQAIGGPNTSSGFAPLSACTFLDVPAAGTYTYKLQARIPSGSGTVGFVSAKVVGWEL